MGLYCAANTSHTNSNRHCNGDSYRHGYADIDGTAFADDIPYDNTYRYSYGYGNADHSAYGHAITIKSRVPNSNHNTCSFALRNSIASGAGA